MYLIYTQIKEAQNVLCGCTFATDNVLMKLYLLQLLYLWQLMYPLPPVYSPKIICLQTAHFLWAQNSHSCHNRTGVCSVIFRYPWKKINCKDNITINTHNTQFFCHKNKPVIDVFDTLQSVGSTSGATWSWQDHLVRRAKEAVQGERCLLLVRVIICAHSYHRGQLRPHGLALCSHGPPDYQSTGKIKVSVAIFLYSWVCL